MEYDNLTDLKNAITVAVEKAVENIALEIQGVIKKSIEVYTYGLTPNVKYVNSFDFEDKAWIVAKDVASDIAYSVYYDGLKMAPPDADNPYRHGNFNLGIDRRQELAELLNVRGYADNADFRKSGNYNSDGSIPKIVQNEKFREPFFDKAIEWIEHNWQALATKHLRAQGLNVGTGSSEVSDFVPGMADIEDSFVDYGDRDPIFD